MMENSVRMMLMGVTQYLALKVNNVLTILHHKLEQSVFVLMAMLQIVTLNVLVSSKIATVDTIHCYTYRY